ncbi:MAG: group II intron reverse transcriptase/maturase [Thiohalophilus sp.]|nr:group II intron reverse transcriptase/maturase [Thiohalophilus sp.]MDZ7803164.1 group II intron reverse transcriptase/maturase [Thiohalophilus sp.]
MENGQLGEEEEPMNTTKSLEISKYVVWEAYKRVKANRGAAGVDGESLAEFERHLKGNLYKLWNRLSSGSYFPPPVKQVEIPKKDGGKRCLGVPTVSDRIAQMVVKLSMEPLIEPHFHPDSYGYRPRKSAKAAVAVTRQRCWQYDWVVEFDIKGAFDNIDHTLLMNAVRYHVKEQWMLLYIERWLTAPFETVDGQLIPRDKGTPQGGVISPLLMNLFMHYAFDKWMVRKHPRCPFTRYADDAVVHCHHQAEAERLLVEISDRLQDCLPTMHPDKSKVVYCKDSNRKQDYPQVQFTFLGFTFKPRVAISRSGKRFTSFLPAVSIEALKRMRQSIKGWRLHRQTFATLEKLAQQYNPILRGWWNYYGCFYKTEMRSLMDYLDQRLSTWARRKYKKLKGHKRQSFKWLSRVAKRQPRLFFHWQLLGHNDRIMGAV